MMFYERGDKSKKSSGRKWTGVAHDVGSGARRKMMFGDAGDRRMAGQPEGAYLARGQQEEKDQDKSLHSFGCVFRNTSPTRSPSGTYPDEYSVQGKSQSFGLPDEPSARPFVIGSTP